MLALCREQRLEHRTKHIALRYFLARELQQRGQLRLAYVASEANTADVFTKALAPCDHQRLCTQLVPASHQVAPSHQVAAAGRVPTSGPVAASCSCRSLAHPTVLYQHRLGHPSIPRLRTMASQRLVLGLPRVLPSLPPSLAPPCAPCVEGRMQATPHSSSLRLATEPFETLHLDVWNPASRPGPERESFFLVVIDDYSRYTTVFPLAKKSEVTSTLVRWLLTTVDIRGRRVSCLHSDRGGLVMDIACTSMIHACAPHFLWPYAVRYAAHQLNLWPRVSRPGALPTSLWTGSPGVASRFHVWGCLALVRDTSVNKISPRASSICALTAAVTEFASTLCLDYATRLMAAPPTNPLAVGGESDLGCDTLEDRQFELEFLAIASPHLCAMLLAPEGDRDALDIPTPRTYDEAVSGPWTSQWRAAMDSEMASYRSTGTYVDDVPTPGANVFDGMWIFGVKRPPRSPPVFKARYVARGFSQRKGVDFFQTFPSSADPSLFVRRGSTPFFVLVYVDGLVFATADRVALADVKSKLQKRHTCTDLGELRHYLGLQITKDRAARTITLSKSHMVQQVLQRFELQHSTVQRTPLAVDHRITGPFPNEPFEPSGPYAELVGCLMYLMTCARPDLAFPLSILARFVVPGRHCPVHWTAPVRVAKYLATTSGMGLVLGGGHSVVLTSHCDSSYAENAETHRSTQGYCFSLGSGAVSWRSTRSSSVLTSTTEAEIYAGAMAAQELRWLTFLLTDLGERPSSAPTLFTDNKASILLCREPRLESKVKHINVRYFLLQVLQRRGQARFDFAESEANTTNIFTKALPPCDHQRCCVQLGLIDIGSRLV
ncbi:unnamed protein product [Closterium sp. NIES-54]